MSTVIVPVENLRVPLEEFAAQWDEAARRWYGDGRTSRYHAGILAACQWVARQAGTAPVTRAEKMATTETIRAEMSSAYAVIDGFPDAPDVHRDWALGVASLLGWVYGLKNSRPPLRVMPASKAS